ncbi:Asparagine synthetase domain-containing protein 1 [Holothuria leucospilota]|uniref:Asparagine synthetase domain-containing protein 1 n=1 Tax=Holothuria leucospilota TaxID=206669 RepID=A0A9Q1HBE8_HOLLE|nr:Asparagine synthetase domain-containing protein 1 [Holothuria leucospilota]
MCGICIFMKAGVTTDCGPPENLEKILQRRGPDASFHLSKHVKVSSKEEDEDVKLFLSGHTLQLQGPVTQQPMVDNHGNMLMWNGEIFAGEIKVDDEENDGLVLLSNLSSCSSDGDVLSVMSKVKGPWSFIYWQEDAQSLFFGRDFLGRRSLLWSCPGEDAWTFALSSVAQRPSLDCQVRWQEVPANGIYKLNITQQKFACSKVMLERFPWQQIATHTGVECETDCNTTRSGCESQIAANSHLENGICIKDITPLKLPSPVAPLNKCLPEDDFTPTPVEDCVDSFTVRDEMRLVAGQLIQVLGEAVRRRVQNVPLRTSRDSGLSWTFKDFQDRCLGEGSDKALRSSFPDDFETLNLQGQVDCIRHLPASVAILFSGGIDSMVLAALSDRYIPRNQSIDLLNVAFEQKKRPHINKTDETSEEEWDPFAVPDRITGRTGLKELQKLNPDRVWNFVEVDVSLEELKQVRNRRISDLIYPLISVLDDSIGCAMWFAARGTGVLSQTEDKDTQKYISTSKVVLSGLGADEQLAGYARHRTHFSTAGWEGLLSQLDMELGRISSRNMGRDDRIISDHGREARFPFLDEDVVSFINSLPIQLKADLTLPRGEGEKRLLRVAARQLGLTESTKLPKRAIQFGSRIAKLEDSSQKGSHVCERLTKAENLT